MRNEFFYKTKWNLQGIWKVAQTSTASLSLSYENLITTLIRRLILTAGASNGGIYYPTFFCKEAIYFRVYFKSNLEIRCQIMTLRVTLLSLYHGY